MPSIGSWYVIINFSIVHPIKPCSWKVMFPVTSSLLLPQFSTYRHWTGFIVKRKQVRITNYLGIPINFFFFLKIFIFKDDLNCIPWVAAQAVHWPVFPNVTHSHLSQCSKSCDLQTALNCAIRGAQGVLPCVWWGVRPVNWIYRLWRHCP